MVAEKIKKAVLAVLIGLFISGPAWAAYGGGSGTAGDPYLINTPAQMQAIGADPCDWDKHFKLTADIDLSAYTGEEYNIIGTYPGDHFSGVFDGNGHTISNFTYSSVEKDYLGLFGYITDPNTEIKNLGLLQPNVDGGIGGCVGALIGYMRHGSVSNCYVEGGSVSGENYVGGLMGGRISAGGTSGTIVDSYSTCSVSGDFSVGGLVGGHGGISPGFVAISNCYATGNVSGQDGVGGLVGQNDGMISDSYATGSVSVVGDYPDYAGGLVGTNGYMSISNCSASGNVIGYRYVGGLAGSNHGTISRSCATGNVSGGSILGGLVANNYAGSGPFGDANGTITESYATGTVSGTSNEIGGLVARNYSGPISNCYAVGNVTGHTQLAGLVAGNYGGAISNCYATGSVTATADWGADNTAGLVGLQEDGGTIRKCYSTGHVSWGYPENGGGGFLGRNTSGAVQYSFWNTQTSGWSTSAGGTGKTTAEMQTQTTFTDVGWDFLGESANGTEDIWRLCVDLTSYPLLAWQMARVGDFVCPDGVDALDLAFFLERWLADNCDQLNGYCDSTDLDRGGEVDGKDYGLFAGYWSDELTALALDEDFETGDFSKYDWQHSGNASWVAVSDVKYEGSYSAKSGAISHSEETVLEISVNTGIGSVSFYCKVSSEADEDYLRFYIDDDLQDNWSGEQDWSLQEYAITSGPHTLKWSYEKDASMSNGSDCAWIDKITVIGGMP
jgi:hypothetical protein